MPNSKAHCPSKATSCREYYAFESFLCIRKESLVRVIDLMKIDPCEILDASFENTFSSGLSSFDLKAKCSF